MQAKTYIIPSSTGLYSRGHLALTLGVELGSEIQAIKNKIQQTLAILHGSVHFRCWVHSLDLYGCVMST